MAEASPPRRRRPRKPRPQAAPPGPVAEAPDVVPEAEPTLVEYGDGDAASPFAMMLGGLIDANVRNKLETQATFHSMRGRVGIEVVDIDESVTLDFQAGHLVVHNGLKPNRAITISADAETVMQLSNVKTGPFGLPMPDSTSRSVAQKALTRKLKIDGLPFNLMLLTKLTRVFSVQ